jgi:hypothetical protein
MHIWKYHSETHLYNYILIEKKRESTDICCDIDEPWKHYAKWRKDYSHKIQHIIWLHVCKVFKIGEAHSQIVD